MITKIPDRDQMEIARQAKQLRALLLIGDETPIGNDLPAMVQKLGIILLEYPIPRVGSNSFCAIFCRTRVDDRELQFLGVNTWDYYDRQLFAIAHELYHYLNHDQPHISRGPIKDNPVEQKADWFAAELLLPLEILKAQILEEFGKVDISQLPPLTFLRFIARLHCTWRLPYKAIVNRLYEANAVDERAYQALYAIDERDENETYYRIGKTTSPEVFRLLNTQTRCRGTESKNLECCLRNYEDGIISEEELCSGLELFDRSPDDFGISFLDDGSDDEEDDADESGGSGNEG